jgi:hypothetical protein
MFPLNDESANSSMHSSIFARIIVISIPQMVEDLLTLGWNTIESVKGLYWSTGGHLFRWLTTPFQRRPNGPSQFFQLGQCTFHTVLFFPFQFRTSDYYAPVGREFLKR